MIRLIFQFKELTGKKMTRYNINLNFECVEKCRYQLFNILFIIILCLAFFYWKNKVHRPDLIECMLNNHDILRRKMETF